MDPIDSGASHTASASPSVRTVGRPLAELNLETLQALCQVHATDEEIADSQGVSVRTIERRRKDDPAFAAIFAKGKAEGKLSVRKAQFIKATVDRDTGMLIWLGKQILDQKERHEITGANGGPIEIASIQRMLDNLPEAEFRRWAKENGVPLPDELAAPEGDEPEDNSEDEKTE
jgi:hypothetical protein